MSRVENRPTRATVDRPEALARILVVAADGGARSRIRRVLGEAGQPPVAAVADLPALAGYQVDEASVLVVVCDVDRPAEVTALRKLSRAACGAEIIVVSPQVTATAVRRTLDAGADALVFESELETALIPTLQAVENGQSVVPRELRAGVARPYLSYRERQVLNLVRDGLTNGEIARTLVLAESTIKSHLASIFTKFGVHSRREAAAAFAELNLANAEVAGAEDEHA